MVNPEKRDSESPETRAEEELLGLGLKALPENIKAVLDMQKTAQHPEGSKKIIEGASSPEELRDAMREKGVSKVIHFEGPSVWEHCKLAVRLASLLNIPEDKKEDIKLIMLYHDLGKTSPELKSSRANIDAMQRELKKGKLYQTMVGHAEERLPDIEKGFKANGVSGHKLEVFMTVVKNHMNTSLLEMSPQKLVKLFETFGKNEEEIKEVAELLALALQVDGNATSNIELSEDGQIQSFGNERKTEMSFEKVWTRYQQGKERMSQ